MTSSSEARARVIHGPGPVTLLVTPDLGTGRPVLSARPATDDHTADTYAAAADEARRSARAQGWAVGWADGLRAGREEAAREAVVRARDADAEREQLEQRLRDAERALRVAAGRLDERAAEVAATADVAAAQVAVAVTEAVLGRAASEQLPQDVLVRALASVDRGESATVRVAASIASLVDDAGLPDGVVLRADPALAPADAVVELAQGVVDLRVGTALARVREALQ